MVEVGLAAAGLAAAGFLAATGLAAALGLAAVDLALGGSVLSVIFAPRIAHYNTVIPLFNNVPGLVMA